MKEKIKKILTKHEAKLKVKEGIKLLADIVGVTLGPSGRPVLIEREGLPPLATKDGVTVARIIGVEDSSINTVIEASKEICMRTAKEAGDGTTSAIVMASKLAELVDKYFEEKKISPQLFMRKMEKALEIFISLVEKNKSQILTEDELYHIAMVAVNGDEEMSKVVIEAVKQSGDEGHITILESLDKNICVEKTEGYRIQSGLKETGSLLYAFINNRNDSCFQGQNGIVMLYNGQITDISPIKTLVSVIEDSVQKGYMTYNNEAIVVIAHGFSDTVYELMAKETLKGKPILPIKTVRTGVPMAATEMLYDLASYFNCNIIDVVSINELKLEDLGMYKTIKINHYDTIVTNYENTSEAHQNRIDERIKELRSQLEQAPSEFDKSHIRSAIARLSEGLVTIKVGGNSDIEIREKKARIEDAVEALRSAIQTGYVSGGGSTHLRIAYELRQYQTEDLILKDALNILAETISHPSFLLLDNAGVNYIWEEYQERIKNQDYSVYDALNHTWLSSDQKNIIEPVKVLTSSVSNAVSVAGLLTTLGGIVTVPRNAEMEASMDVAQSIINSIGGR